MKITGVTRRIDELGRVVIPKEFRRLLSIRDGENLEIFIEDDKIVLRKYLFMKTLLDFSNDIISIYSDILPNRIIITDREKVICSTSNDDKIVGKTLDNKLIKLVDNRESLLKDGYDEIKFNDIFIKDKMFICPIINENDSLGLIIILFDEESDCIKEHAKIISKLISNKLNIY